MTARMLTLTDGAGHVTVVRAAVFRRSREPRVRVMIRDKNGLREVQELPESVARKVVARETRSAGGSLRS